MPAICSAHVANWHKAAILLGAILPQNLRNITNDSPRDHRPTNHSVMGEVLSQARFYPGQRFLQFCLGKPGRLVGHASSGEFSPKAV